MAGKRTVDIKLFFEQFDMMPGATGKKFQRNLLLNGGSADTQGFSITDCFLRLDDYAVQNGQLTTLPAPAGVLAAPGAGVPAVPAGNVGQIAAAVAAQHAARKARLKQSFTFLCSHISDSSTLELLGDPLSPLFHNGPDAYDWIMQQVIKPPSTGDLQDMTIEFWLMEIITDIGITANSIADSIKMLRVVNAEFPLARRFSDDQLSEKLLSMVEHGSKMFALEAKKELDAVEGVPGTPGVRLFQLAVPAAGGPRPRDLNGIIVFWQGQWESAVKSRALPVAPATGQAGKARKRHQADGANVATETAFAFAVAPATRETSPSHTLRELTDAGFALTRRTVTTSDWRLAGRSELARSATDGDGGEGFSIETCYDADDTPSIEMLCDCCGGAGHKRLVCPSPPKHRSHMYLVALHSNAAKRKDDNGLTKYGAAVGGRRSPPRGQKAPFKQAFKAMPRRYSAATPFRRFEPGTPRPTQGQLQAARELLERELLETEDGDAERADAVTEAELAVTDAARVTTQRMPAHLTSLLALQEHKVTMPSIFSIDDFYSETGFGVTEVELPTPKLFTGSHMTAEFVPVDIKPPRLMPVAMAKLKAFSRKVTALTAGIVILVILLLSTRLAYERSANAHHVDHVTDSQPIFRFEVASTALVVEAVSLINSTRPPPKLVWVLPQLAAMTAKKEGGVANEDSLAPIAMAAKKEGAMLPVVTSVPRLASATSTGLATPGREMPSVFSSEGFYCEDGFGAREVEHFDPLTLPNPRMTIDMPTAVLARDVDPAYGANPFVLTAVSHGFQDPVLEYVDGVYAAEEVRSHEVRDDG